MLRSRDVSLLLSGFTAVMLASLGNAGSVNSATSNLQPGGKTEALSLKSNGLDNTLGSELDKKNPVKVAQATGTGTVIKVNGQPFFPFGFYHVSHYSQMQPKMLADLKTVAAAGFNTMHVPLSLSSASGAYLDEAARLGVYTINEFNDDPMSVINAYKNKPAVLGWNVSDDCNDGTQTAAQISQFSKQVKAAAPQHITYMSCYDNASSFTNLANVFAMQSYPISGEELSVAGQYFKQAVDATAPYAQPVIANVQLFNWGGQRPPTSLELRNMTYQSIITGVKGIIYYTFFDEGWDLAKNPGLWSGVKSLAPEVKQLSPFFLSGKRTRITTGNYYTQASLWEYQNRSVIIVLNSHQTQVQNVDLALPISLKGATRTFTNRPAGLVVKNGRLSGAVKAQAVHIYNLQS